MKINDRSRQGIVLAGGNGTRLYPNTISVNKQLLPIYDKPMVYYSITTLMLAGVKDIIVVTSEPYLASFRQMLGNGEKWGISIEYLVQENPNGIPEVFKLLPKERQRDENILILGDNVLYGVGLGESLNSIFDGMGALCFAYSVADPKDYGVLVFNERNQVIQIVEKPKNPVSNYAIPGLYFFDKSVFSKVSKLEKSSRGELEIVDLLNLYLNENLLQTRILERGTAWLDTGNQNSILDASEFVRVIETRQGLKIGCPEEVALRMGYIHKEQFLKTVSLMPECEYKKYLSRLVD